MAGQTKTLRCRMLLVAAVCIVGVLAVAGAALAVIFDRHMLETIGRDLDVRWSDLARDITVGPDGEMKISQPERDSRYGRFDSGAYWQVSEGGETILRSPSLGHGQIDLSRPAAMRDGSPWFEVEAPGGRELYVAEREVTVGPPGSPRSVLLAVALDHDQIAAARAAFQWDLFYVLVLIALVLVAAAGLQLHVILSPLARLRAELNAVREGQAARLNLAVPAEVEPLAIDLNRLLDGQEELVKKARERAGSLAHGLKTPIAVFAAECRRLESEGQGEAARRLREQITSIQTHVERELARARTHGATAALGAYVDASKTAERLVRVMTRLPRGEELSWRYDPPDRLMLQMDPDDFGEILGNLLDNARKWARGAVSLRIEASASSARIVVEDDGPGFGSDATPPSLTAGDRESSAGLGLVIVQDILAAYGSALWIDRAAPNGVVSFTLARRSVTAAAQAASERRPPAAIAAPARAWFKEAS